MLMTRAWRQPRANHVPTSPHKSNSPRCTRSLTPPVPRRHHSGGNRLWSPHDGYTSPPSTRQLRSYLQFLSTAMESLLTRARQLFPVTSLSPRCRHSASRLVRNSAHPPPRLCCRTAQRVGL